MTAKSNTKTASNQENQDKDDSTTAQQRKGRIVIRNLVYDINEKLLRNLLTKYGEIAEINLPLNPSTNKAKGFAFVQFANKNCALKAINELNGSKWKGRNIVLDLAVSKDEYQQATQKPEKPNKENEKIKKEEDQGNNENEEEINESDKDIEEEEEEEEEEEQEEEEGNQTKKDKKQNAERNTLSKNEDLSKTCFVRNLSYEISDQELKEFCANFGKVEMAKVCMNHETGSNKGTGFVKFKDPEVARKLIAKSDENSASFLKQKHGNSKNNNIHDIFSGVSELDLEMNGRRIIFLEAKKREEVSKFIDEKNERNSIQLEKVKSLEQLELFDRQQKRNIHLAKLGIFEEEKSMSPEEKEKRRQHLQEKIQKLKNPNNQVSSTRIALMNLPKEDFQEEEIKLYSQIALTSQHGNDYIKKQNPIKQVLLLRDKNKLDKEGIPRSRGIGFVEFESHDQALSFLEYCIKDKGNFEKKYKKTPIIEFSIEDIRKMQKKNKIRETIISKQKSNKLDKKPKTKEEREEHKKILNNNNNAAKLKITEILKSKNTSEDKYEEGVTLLKDVHSRGIKQRLGKMLKKKFGIEEEQKDDFETKVKENEEKDTLKKNKEEKRKQILKNQVIQEKVQRKIEQKNKKQVEENDLELEASELIKAVSKELKKNKLKRKAEEDHDDLDDVLQKHLQKKVKKTKQESNQL